MVLWPLLRSRQGGDEEDGSETGDRDRNLASEAQSKQEVPLEKKHHPVSTESHETGYP